MSSEDNRQFCILLDSIRSDFGSDIVFYPKRLKNVLSDLNLKYKNEEKKFMFLINEHQSFVKSIYESDNISNDAVFDKISSLCGFNDIWTENVAIALFTITGKRFDTESNTWITENALEKKQKETIDYGDGTIYTGEVSDGSPEGYGKMVFSNGETYEGFFLNGKRDGKGKYTWPTGAFYDGIWANGLREDEHGHQQYVDGSIYEGGWKEGIRNGLGTHTWNDGRKYVGLYKNDKRNGKGIMTFPDNAIYDGEWVDDEYHGHGSYTRKDGFKYIGEWGIDAGSGYGIYVVLDSEYKKTWVYDGSLGVHHPINFA